ncbi:Uracil phosphoribosyltransferase [Frankliniella fusca]|uniref:Uracil phosphoribosyltransferase n=1 Tax=Frankliniella fusca TaxID=407009 RepID=A0AAE1LU03_9NEOP|nr:Uracil phosphoribosyltransferase [Frankliniella fusca]
MTDIEYCNEWLINQHSVPLAQYGHYWSSISGILQEDQTSETESVTYQNGDSSKPRVRKVSNIPMGADGLDENDGDQNGHAFPVGTNGVRDVRKQKTMFTNLSPYRN